MSLDRVQARTETPAHRNQPADDPQELVSPFLTTTEACVYLRYGGKHRLRTLYRFLQRKGIRTSRRHRRLLIRRRDLDAAIGFSDQRRTR